MPANPFVANGRYRIVNVENGDVSADLFAGSKFGAITGVGTANLDRQKWIIENLLDRGILIRSASTPESYASVYSENEHVPLAGSDNATIWTLVPTDTDSFYISTANGLSWYVNNGGHNTAIVLVRPPAGGAHAQWRFVPA